MDMPLNVEVYCVDGVCGRSKEVIVDHETEKVTHLVVREKDSPSAEILVPVDLVTKTTPHEILLRSSTPTAMRYWRDQREVGRSFCHPSKQKPC
jgi:hypothetical protein